MKILLSISTLIGHLHPLVVHLPLGILLAALGIWLMSRKQEHSAVRHSLRWLLLAGAVAAVLSCISGYILSGEGGYDETMVSRHQWSGIVTAALAILFYFVEIGKIKVHEDHLFRYSTATLLAIGLFWTGHLGGSLTHGEGYLTEALSGPDPSTDDTIPTVANVQEAKLYSDLVQPILQARCIGCHGPAKQKGGLRLDGLDNIRKGGKDGPVIVDGTPEKSELVKRLLLPADDEHRMPPKGKPSLTQAQIGLIQWWVKLGISTDKKVKEMPQSDSVRRMLAGLQNRTAEGHAGLLIPGLPVAQIKAAPDQILDSLKTFGILVMPVAHGNSYLMANLVNTNISGDSSVMLLLPLKEQLVELKASGAALTDEGCRYISQLKKLVWLKLDNNKISDKGVALMAGLDSLRTISLTGTQVTSNGVMGLGKLTNLREIFLFHSGVQAQEFVTLRKSFPQARIDSGGYTQEFLASDTTIFKKPIPVK